MKKLVLLFTIMAVSFVSVTAQEAYINVKAGANSIYYVGATDVNSIIEDEAFGYQFGAEFGFKFFKLLGFRGEANYVNNKFTLVTDRETGTAPDGTVGNYNIKETMNIINNGIQIPTSLTLDLGMFDINVGPNFEFLLSSVAGGNLEALIDSAGAVAESYPIDYDFFNDEAGKGAYFDQVTKDGDIFSQFNLGLNLGLGINLKGIRIDLKTNYTLTDAVSDYYDFDQGEEVERAVSFQLSAAFNVYKFKLFGGNDDDDDSKEDEDGVKVKDFFGTMQF
jgi:hypothetical protein